MSIFNLLFETVLKFVSIELSFELILGEFTIAVSINVIGILGLLFIRIWKKIKKHIKMKTQNRK